MSFRRCRTPWLTFRRLHRRLLRRAKYLTLQTACYLALRGWLTWPERWAAVCLVRDRQRAPWTDELMESQLSVCDLERGLR